MKKHLKKPRIYHVPSPCFDRPNTFFNYDFNGHCFPLQFKLGDEWHKIPKSVRDGWSNQDSNTFVFDHFLDKARYNDHKICFWANSSH